MMLKGREKYLEGIPGWGGGGKDCYLKQWSGEASLMSCTLEAISTRSRSVWEPGGHRCWNGCWWKKIPYWISYHGSFVSETWRERKEDLLGSPSWRGTWSWWALWVIMPCPMMSGGWHLRYVKIGHSLGLVLFSGPPDPRKTVQCMAVAGGGPTSCASFGHFLLQIIFLCFALFSWVLIGFFVLGLTVDAVMGCTLVRALLGVTSGSDGT